MQFKSGLSVMGCFYASLTGTTVLQLKDVPARPEEYDGRIALFGSDDDDGNDDDVDIGAGRAAVAADDSVDALFADAMEGSDAVVQMDHYFSPKSGSFKRQPSFTAAAAAAAAAAEEGEESKAARSDDDDAAEEGSYIPFPAD